jgi:hypothetical protein
MSRRDKDWIASLLGAFLLVVLTAVVFGYTLPELVIP